MRQKREKRPTFHSIHGLPSLNLPEICVREKPVEWPCLQTAILDYCMYMIPHTVAMGRHVGYPQVDVYMHEAMPHPSSLMVGACTCDNHTGTHGSDSDHNTRSCVTASWQALG